MKKIIVSLCFVIAASYSVSAQDKTNSDKQETVKPTSSQNKAAGKKLKEENVQLTPAQRQLLDKVAKNPKAPLTKGEQEMMKEINRLRNINNPNKKVAQPVRPLTPAELQNIQKGGQPADPAHPPTAAEMDQYRMKHPEQKLQQQPPHSKPLSAAEMKKMEDLKKKGKPIPPELLVRYNEQNRQPTPPELANQQLHSNNPNDSRPNAQSPQQAPLPQDNTQGQQQTNVDPDGAKFEFIGGENYNYGEILESVEPAEHNFEFINTGKKPLIINEAHGSCGCTVPTYSKDPVLPGQKGSILVKYNSRGRVGPISKEVYISSNAVQTKMVLHISGTVKSNPDLNGVPPPVPQGTAPSNPATGK